MLLWCWLVPPVYGSTPTSPVTVGLILLSYGVCVCILYYISVIRLSHYNVYHLRDSVIEISKAFNTCYINAVCRYYLDYACSVHPVQPSWCATNWRTDSSTPLQHKGRLTLTVAKFDTFVFLPFFVSNLDKYMRRRGWLGVWDRPHCSLFLPLDSSLNLIERITAEAYMVSQN